MFNPADLIHTYTRAEAIADGVFVDATQSDLAEVSRQHYQYPIAMTAGVFDLISRAVANKRYCNDYPGVWHDILWMSRRNIVNRPSLQRVVFRVKITGTGRRQWHTLHLLCHPGDNGEPVLTVLLPRED